MSASGVKYIKIPEPVAVVDTLSEGRKKPVLEGAEPMVVSLRKLVLLALEHDSFKKTTKDFRVSHKIADWIDAAAPGSVVPVSEDHLSRLATAMEGRTIFGGIPNWVLRQCGSLFDALELEAKDRAEDFDPPSANGVKPAAEAAAPQVAQA